MESQLGTSVFYSIKVTKMDLAKKIMMVTKNMVKVDHPNGYVVLPKFYAIVYKTTVKMLY